MLNPDDSAIEMKPVSSQCAAEDFCVIESFKGDECFGGAGEDMGFIESVKPAVPRLVEDKISKLCDILGGEEMGENFSYS